MLTGQLKPTMGEITLPPNYDLISGNRNNQEKIGLCSQNNILIPNLTAKEHLELYAKFKMRNGYNAEIKNIFNALKFGKYKNFQAKELSGGYQRRLCVAIAFLASPNLVILDEPCSGVDTKARQNIWDLIQTLRKGRAVVLATHFMDEAEQLSDKIVIINQGRVIAENSLDELRRQLTKSLELNVQFGHTINEKDKAMTIDNIRTSIKEVIPGTQVSHISSTTYSLTIPYLNQETGEYYNFEPIIRSLENLQTQRKISSFNIITQNLKDTFDQLNRHEINGNGNIDRSNGAPISVTSKDEKEADLTTTAMITSLFWKRLRHFTRNYRMLLCILVLPVIFECIAMLFMKVRPPGEYDIALPLERELYPGSTDFYSYQNGEGVNDTSNFYSRPVYESLLDLNCAKQQQCRKFNNSLNAFNWILDTNDDYVDRRYGGVVVNGSKLSVWYNNKGYHSLPTYMNVLNNAILRKEMNDSSFKITTVNHPLKLGDLGLSYSSILQQVADAGISLIILVAFSLVLAGASVFIVNERVNGEKLQQQLCGITLPIYWGVTFIWDFVIYCIALVAAVIVFEVFGIPLYVDKDQLAGICLLLLLFGFAVVPMVHVFEKCFGEPSFANMSIFCLNVIVALSTMTIILVLEVLSETDEDEEFRKSLNKVLIILPQHALADGLRQIVQNYIVSRLFERYYINTYKSPVSSDLLSFHFTSLIVTGIIFIIINFLIESKVIHKFLNSRISRETKDSASTVSSELEFISIQNAMKDTYDMTRSRCVLNVVELKKRYTGHKEFAVKGVSFYVKDGECFGLLGTNGAGKSTIFGILTGEILPTSGHVKIRTETGISYCPQTNALDPLLTVTEVIRFYGRLRKIKDIEQLIQKTLDSLHLSQYSNVLVKNLSGGNRRKLSVAVTCLGRTNIVLMDEPTSDMDPITRNVVYKVIRGLVENNRAVLLTSHSISEIENICHRLAVIKDGRLLTTGTPQHLKETYGNCYIVTILNSNSGLDPNSDIVSI